MAVNNKESSIRHYLLGQLSEDKQQEIEQRLLLEEDLLEDLEITETQLIDDYVAGHLTEGERQQFDSKFLTTPERQQDLQFARVFRRFVASNPIPANADADQSWWQQWQSPSWVFRLAAAGLAVAMIGLALWFAVPRASSPEQMVAMTLTFSANNRAEGAPTQKIPLPAGSLKASLRLPEVSAPGENYRVKLVSGNGETKIFEVVERDAQTVTIIIPAGQLTRAPYAFKLIKLNADGTEQPVNGSYYFTVE